MNEGYVVKVWLKAKVSDMVDGEGLRLAIIFKGKSKQYE
jgi:hypothetical protein